MTTASEINDGTRKRRDRATKENPAVVDLEAQRKRTEELQQYMREQADKAVALALQVKALNAERKIIFDEVEAQGIDRKAFKDAIKLRTMETDQRDKYEASRRQLVAAFGFNSGEQLDMLDPVIKAGERAREELPLDGDRTQAILDHIDKHGTNPAKH